MTPILTIVAALAVFAAAALALRFWSRDESASLLAKKGHRRSDEPATIAEAQRQVPLAGREPSADPTKQPPAARGGDSGGPRPPVDGTRGGDVGS